MKSLAKDIHERWQKLNGITEGCDDCDTSKGCKCEDGKCDCPPKSGELPAVPRSAGSETDVDDQDDMEDDEDEENPELEQDEPVELQEDGKKFLMTAQVEDDFVQSIKASGDYKYGDGESEEEDEDRVVALVMERIKRKPVQSQVALYDALSNKLMALVKGMPNGEMKLKALMRDFKKEQKI